MNYKQQPSPDEEKTFTREVVVQMLGAPALQDWTQASAGFNVLGSPVILGGLTAQEQQPLWATKVEALRKVPLLFEAINLAKTKFGLNWETAVSGKRVLT